MGRALAAGVASMSLGALVVGTSLLARATLEVRAIAAIVGFVAVAGGPLVTALGLRKPLMEELYLAMRDDGVLLHFEGPEMMLPWDSIERVAYDDAQCTVCLQLRSGEAVRVQRDFAGITGDALARRLDDCRRKARFNLLR